jgi:hypothetical protein
MRAGGSNDEDDQRRYDQRSEVSGSAADVVQARDVHGGVHFHGTGRVSGPVPKQLPGDVRGFVNRTAELAQLDEAVRVEDDNPLIAGTYVITGTAGVGKTSLALHWAHGVRGRFPDGQLYVNLRGYDPGPPVSPTQALDAFLRALGVTAGNIPVELADRAALYRSILADRRMLVLLDNAATVGQVRPLLPGNSECLVLVTSRSRLSGLIARDGARRLTLDMLSDDEAVKLLRAITASYRGEDDPEDLAELARLCARLPLALRIAAERASSRPLMLLTELIADLRDESALWDALTADDDDEADAVRSVFAWSYRALPESAARTFRLLGLHPGHEFGVSAVASLCGIDKSQARHLLDILVGAHLVEQRSPGRYQFHDLLRAYAIDQVIQREPLENRVVILTRVLCWYLVTAHNAVLTIAPLNRHIELDPPVDGVVPLMFDNSSEAFQWYEEERANLVAATLAAASAELHRLAWQIPVVLRNIYARQNTFEEWVDTARVGLESARHVRDRNGEAELLESLGMAYVQSRRLVEAEEFHRKALEVRRAIGDSLGTGMSINALGLIAWRQRRLADASAFLLRRPTSFRSLDNVAGKHCH